MQLVPRSPLPGITGRIHKMNDFAWIKSAWDIACVCVFTSFRQGNDVFCVILLSKVTLHTHGRVYERKWSSSLPWLIFTKIKVCNSLGGSMCTPVDSHLWTLTHLASKTLYAGSRCHSSCQRPFWNLWLEVRFWSSSSRLMHLHWLVHFHSPLPRPEGSIHPPSVYRIIYV